MDEEARQAVLLTDFEENVVDDKPPSDKLVIDVDGFEGPLDLLLTLARDQKVDLTQISMCALAEQFLSFIDKARQLRLEIAADYLVMAAWLAYLKSRLLLPKTDDGDEPTGEELAEALAFRLRRLEAMRDVAARLVNRDRLGREVFARGDPEPIMVHEKCFFSASLYDLLKAYADQRQKTFVQTFELPQRTVISLKDARERLVRLVGDVVAWAPLDSFLVEYINAPEMRVTAAASSFSASLELVREGHLEMRQSATFAPIYVRRAPSHAGEPPSVR